MKILFALTLSFLMFGLWSNEEVEILLVDQQNDIPLAGLKLDRGLFLMMPEKEPGPATDQDIATARSIFQRLHAVLMADAHQSIADRKQARYMVRMEWEVDDSEFCVRYYTNNEKLIRDQLIPIFTDTKNASASK